MSTNALQYDSTVTFDKATIKDTKLVLCFIKELAKFEEFPDKVTATENDLANNLFSDKSTAEVLICNIDRIPCGFAVYFNTFSTTTGKPGIHLDDLFILPEYQSRGLGTLFLAHLSNIALERGCARFEWWALKSNISAHGFYRHIGARTVDEINVFRLAPKSMQNLISTQHYSNKGNLPHGN